MDSLLNRGVDLGDNVRVAAILAVRAGLPIPMGSAVRQALGGGDREDAAQVRHLAKDVGQGIAQPLADRRMDVHMAVKSPSRTPAISGRFSKKALGMARGLFR